MVLVMASSLSLLLSTERLSPRGEKQFLRAPVFISLSIHSLKKFGRSALIGLDHVGCPPLAQSAVAKIGRQSHGRKWQQLETHIDRVGVIAVT